MSPQDIIDLLRLKPHPNEGGFYREMYRSAARIPQASLPGYSGDRAAGTGIYYLLTPATCSAMHRLPGDEMFHHYLGDAVELLLLHSSGEGDVVVLGKDLERGERPQVVVPGGCWQGSKLVRGGTVALLGTTMSPGFEFADYQHGDRAELIAAYPEWAERIAELTTSF